MEYKTTQTSALNFLKHLPFLFLALIFLLDCQCLKAQTHSQESQELKDQSLFDDFQLRIKEAIAIRTVDADSAVLLLSVLSRKSMQLHNDMRFGFQAQILTELGNTYRSKGDYLKAINYYELGIQFSTIHNLNFRKAKLMNALGGLYQELEDLDNALRYCKMALVIFQTDYPEQLQDLAMLYANVGNLMIIKENNADAQKFLLKANSINADLNDDYLSSLIFSGLGIVQMRLGDFDAALEYFNKGILAATRINSLDTKLALTANMSSAYIQKKSYEKAEKLLIPAYHEAIEINHKYLIKEILSLLVVLYSETDRYKPAYEYQKKYSDLKSDLFSEELNQRIASIDQKLKNTERQKTILELNQLNQAKSYEIRKNQALLAFVSVFSIFTLALIWSYYQRMKAKNTAQIYQMENQMFRLQMKPHFIFNVLSSIGGFMNQNKPQEAGVYLAKFARLIRNVLEQSNQELISITKEIELLKYYLDLQQLRFPDRFKYRIYTDDLIEEETLFIPPMLIQPIVENSIEHGFADRTNCGQIDLMFTQNEDTLVIQIIDNGKGIQDNQSNRLHNDFRHLKKESISSKLIIDQLHYYKTKYRKDFKITFEDLSNTDKNLSGTKVTLSLPLINKKK